MSSFSQFVGVGPKTIQTAWVDGTNAAKSTGTGEDDVYWDFTLATTVTDYTKCQVFFDGGISRATDLDYEAVRYNATSGTLIPSARLTSNTNIRIGSPSDSVTTNHCSGRYWVIEWW